MNAEIITAITALIVAITGPAVVPKIIDAVKATRSGRATEEKRRNRTALNEVEFQTEWRRIISEHAAHVRRIAIEWGVPENMLPAWPLPPSREKVQ